MDFFKYASYAWQLTDTLWLQLLVGGLCFAVVYVFEAIALFTIASREGFKNKWMAFVPFFNTYYIGVCAQKNKFYKIDTKKIGIAAAVFEFVLVALNVLFLVAQIIMINSNVSPTVTATWLGESYFYQLDRVPSDLKWAAWIYNYMEEYILSVLELLYLIVQIILFISFFQTYASRRYVLFTITSILFPIHGILFFVVRNNRGVNYRDFVRAEQARQYRMYQQYYQQNYNRNPYDRNSYDQNPYNRNPYDGNSYGNPSGGTPPSGAPEDPFGDLGGRGTTGSTSGDSPFGGSPFDDFDKN